MRNKKQSKTAFRKIQNLKILESQGRLTKLRNLYPLR